MTQYKQTEFCLDLTQGDRDSLPTWMKGINDRPLPAPRKLQAIETPLFDLSIYASKDAPSKTKNPSRTNPDKRTTVSPSKHRQPKPVPATNI